jgi:hypothetical protein
MRRVAVIAALALLAACQPSAQPQGELPTLAVLPSLTPTDAPTETPAPSATPQTPSATPEPSATPTQTETPLPSQTPRPSRTPTPTIEPTFAVVASATAALVEAPRFATFTPAPPGSTPIPGGPQQMAAVTITEAQFQEEVSRLIGGYPSMQSARVDFVPDGISVELTALGGEAFISGRVFVSIVLSGDFATISLGDITVNAPEPPDAYVETVTGDFFFMMVAALDNILKQRVGEEQDLASIAVTDTSIEVALRVPQS